MGRKPGADSKPAASHVFGEGIGDRAIPWSTPAR